MSWVTYLALLVPPLATPTFCVDVCRMGRPAWRQSFSLMRCLLAPESYVTMMVLIVDVLMYAVVCGKADMLVLVDLFNRPIECRAQL